MERREEEEEEEEGTKERQGRRVNWNIRRKITHVCVCVCNNVLFTTTSPSLGLSLSLVMASVLCTVVPSLVSTHEWASPPSLRGTWPTLTSRMATPTPHIPEEMERE